MPSSKNAHRFVSVIITSFVIFSAPTKVFAHAGHGDEFKSSDTQPKDAIRVDANTAKQIGIKVESVTSRQLELGIKTNGQIEAMPDRKVEITTPIKGKITQFLVKLGDRVQAGQTVAILSSPEIAELRVASFEKRAEADGNIREAQANLTLALQNYDRAQQIANAEIKQAQVELKVDRERYGRDKELLASGAIPSRQVMESEAKLSTAKASSAKAESKLEVLKAQAEIKRAKSALQVAKERIQLSSSTYNARLNQLGANANPDGTIAITSPITGTVSELKATLAESGEDAGKPIMTIVNSDRLLATANIYEKDLSKIKIGQRVRVTVAGRKFTGKVRNIGAIVNGETRIIPVQAEIENPDRTLTVGMFAELEVLTEKSESVVAIPSAAVVEANGRNLVFVQNGNDFQPVEVVLGRTSGDFVEVDNGLFEGDAIATQRATQLYAQSLRGSKPTESTSKPEQVKESSFSPPVWTMLLTGAIAGGGIVATAFWLGRRLPTARQSLTGTKMVILREPSSTSELIDR
jgi:membrane fusion protein, heavy metal efflux system